MLVKNGLPQALCQCPLWTYLTSGSVFAGAVLEVIDPNKVVRWVLSREDCEYSSADKCYMKNLHRLGRPLCSCIMVDDRPEVVMPRENVLPIVKYLEKDPDDEELLDILPLLLSLNKDSDVRHRLRAINESEEVEGSQKEWIADFEKQPQPLPQPAGNVENWNGCMSVAAMLELYETRLHAPLANLIDLTENLIDLTSEVD